MSLDTDENFIQANISSLLSAREVKAKTCEISGEWKLHENEIYYIHSMPRNIEFAVILENGSVCLRVSAKIHRETARLSNIEVEEA